MLLDSQELFVNGQGFRGLFRSRRDELTLRVRQNFLEMTGDGHGNSF